MKKLLSIAALILAFSPLAQAAGLPGNPDARNDRNVASHDSGAMMHHHKNGAKHMHHAKHVHHMKHHHHNVHPK